MLNGVDDIKSDAKNVKLVLFDLFGTLISNGDEKNPEVINNLVTSLSKFIEHVQKKDIKVGIISGTLSEYVTGKFSKIKNCDMYFSSLDKLKLGESIIEKYNLSFDQVLFIGDELFDLPLLRKVGVSVTTQNARREVKRGVKYVLPIECGIGLLDYLLEEVFSVPAEELGLLDRIISSLRS